MSKVKKKIEKRRTAIVFITDLIAVCISLIEHENINIDILRKFVYGLNCVRSDLLLILLLLLVFMLYRVIKYRFTQSTTFTKITYLCILSFVLIQSADYIINYGRDRYFYLSQNLHKEDVQLIPMERGIEAFDKAQYTLAKEKFEEALTLSPNTHFTRDIESYLKRIDVYQKLAAIIYNSFDSTYIDIRKELMTPEHLNALYFCTLLDDNPKYKNQYQKVARDIKLLIDEYDDFYSVCEKNVSSDFLLDMIKENRYHYYFEEELIKEKEKINDPAFLKKIVLADSSANAGKQKIKGRWMLEEKAEDSSVSDSACL